MKIQVSVLREGARIPTRGSAHAAGYDLYACLEHAVEIAPGGSAKIGTGLAVAIPDGYFGAIFARSGLAAEEGLRPANCVGVADSDYRGEYMVVLHNDSGTVRTVRPGDLYRKPIDINVPEYGMKLMGLQTSAPRNREADPKEGIDG